MSYWHKIEISVLVGLVLESVINANDEEIVFKTTTGRILKLYHTQDCCENVRVEDISGDLNDLVGTPILQAEEVSNEPEPAMEHSNSYTWTFYKFATVKGSVTIRWLGESDGYYSERVDFEEVEQ